MNDFAVLDSQSGIEFVSKQTQTSKIKSSGNLARRIIGVLFGVAEIILAFRLVFKLFGANAKNGIVSGIYNITQFFVGIFQSIFPKIAAGSKVVFEPGTMIAIIVVVLVAWVVLILLTSRNENSRKTIASTQSTGRQTTSTVEKPVQAEASC